MGLDSIPKFYDVSLKSPNKKFLNYEKMQQHMKKMRKSRENEKDFLTNLIQLNLEHSIKLFKKSDSEIQVKNSIFSNKSTNASKISAFRLRFEKSKSQARSPELSSYQSNLNSSRLKLGPQRSSTAKNNPALNLLQLSNGIYVNKDNENLFTYFIAQGNNDSLIRKIMKRKKGWVQVNSPQYANFVWTPVKKVMIFDLLPRIPRFKKVVLDSKIPLPGFLSVTEFAAIVPNNTLFLSESKIYNRLEGNEELSNKKKLFYNMVCFYNSQGKDPFKYIPLSFHVSKGTSDPSFTRFVSKFNSIQNMLSSDKYLNNCWVIKPGEDTNRGNGISLSSNLNEIAVKVNEKIICRGNERTYLIQKYIYRPLLYNGRKFDIRCYCLVTCINNNIQAYFYKDGYLRTSCQTYSINNIHDKFIHLTNDAVQKNSPNYGQFEDSNKLSYEEFQTYLDKSNLQHIKFREKILIDIKNMVRDTIFATYSKLNPFSRGHTFEILGYDFMIDEFSNPWLIEVNTNPCLELSGKYLKNLIPMMITHALNITIDQIFVSEETDYNSNLFELIFSENK